MLKKAPLGSMADVPDDLIQQIKYLEKIFTVDQAKLKEVTSHFVKELDKGKSSVPVTPGDLIPNARSRSQRGRWQHCECLLMLKMLWHRLTTLS